MIRLLLAALLATALATPAPAQPISPMTGMAAPQTGPASKPRRAPMRLADRFAAANTTKDGRLTLDQAKAGRMPAVVRHFDAIDTGRKGYVTLDDIRTHRRAQRAARPPAQRP